MKPVGSARQANLIWVCLRARRASSRSPSGVSGIVCSMRRRENPMHMGRWSVHAWMLPVICGLLLPLGCGGQSSSERPPQQRHHIQEIFHFWLVYQMRNKGRSPRDASDLKEWAIANKKAESEMFAKMGIAGHEDSAFLSPRDGQPYILRQLSSQELGMGRTVAFEEVGVEGKRYVVFDTGRAEEIEAGKVQTALQQATPG